MINCTHITARIKIIIHIKITESCHSKDIPRYLGNIFRFNYTLYYESTESQKYVIAMNITGSHYFHNTILD